MLKSLPSKWLRLLFTVEAVVAAMWFVPSACIAQSGIPIWTNHYAGPGNGNDQASAIVADAAGSIYVTGSSAGNSGDLDFSTLKYSSAGAPVWTNRYNGPGNGNDVALEMVVDSMSNVIVTGRSIGQSGYDDIATVKYSGLGLPLWTNRFDGIVGGVDGANAMAVDQANNVFVVGSSYGGSIINNGSGYDWVILKYSPEGIPLWTNRFDMTPTDSALAVAVDPATGHVFVTGYSTTPGFYDRCVTIAYENNGLPLWTNVYGWKAKSDDRGRGIATYMDKVFVIGHSRDAANFDDIITIAYDSSTGSPLWTNRYNGPANGTDYGSRVKIDNTGSPIIAGSSSTGTVGWDFNVMKIIGAGSPIWTARYNGPVNASDHVADMILDPHGNIIVTGDSANLAVSPFDYDFATIALSSSGVPVWTNRFGGLGAGEDRAEAVAVSAEGSVYVTGYSYNGTDWDYTTIKYAPISMSQIPLNISRMENKVVLSWTNPLFTLQSSSLPDVGFTNIPGATSPFTNSLTESSQFFRLKTY